MTEAATDATPARPGGEPRPRIALCLGAHRSGTSLVSAALEALGAELALPGRDASEENLKGFFEHAEVVALDDELLRLAGSAWDDSAFDSRWIADMPAAERRALEERARRIVREQWRPAALSAVKDPRMCRLLPFWLPELKAEGYGGGDIACVIVTRDPVEIAISQRTRCLRNPDFYDFGRTLDEGAALWLSHVRQLLRDADGCRSLVVAYEDFLRRPGELLDSMAGFLGVRPDPAAVDRFIAGFIDESLWRSHADADAAAEVEAAFPELLDAERSLAAFSGRVLGGDETAPILSALGAPRHEAASQRIVSRAYGRLAGRRRAERLEAARTENALQVAREARDAFARSRDEVSAAAAGVEAALREQLTAVEAERDALQQTEAALRASRSWRMTAPLRGAGTAARRMRHVPQAGLRVLNRAGKAGYRRLKRSHPETAEVLRRNLQPLLTRANLRLLGQYSVPAAPARPAGFGLDYQRGAARPDHRPLVTVIVPNYNHAPYLSQRLESIFAQTYDNFEVLLLDDCSTDDSRQVLADFAARHPDRTRTIFNEANSGGVFRQWEKGLAAARGELIWIAESDDWASPDFLAALVPFFRNEAVQLAFGRTVFMDAEGENPIWSMEEYLQEFGPDRWSRAWVETAPNIVREVFSMTNIVPNVSSALFRRFDRLDVLEIDQWRDMRTCGDWMFYLNAIRGGMLAYSPEAQNFYRIHAANTSVTSHKADQFYREHEAVAKCLRRHFRVPAGNLARLQARLRQHWKLNRDDYSDAAFAACFDPARIETAPVRKPGLLMAGYAFCAGGGETFPIQLANEMKAAGYEVTFLDCAQEERVEGVRAMLATDIPVVGNFTDLRRIVENFDINLIHSHHGWTDNTVLDLLPAEAPVSTVVTLHGFYETVQPELLDMQLPRLLARTDAVVYVAEKNLTQMRRVLAGRSHDFHRIDNAVSAVDFVPADRAAMGIPEDAFVLTLVSRALHAKGWAEAIAATTRARGISGRDIHLVLVGDGEARDSAEAEGVPGHVHLLGFRPNTRDYFAAADLGFLPSRFPGESAPLVVIESLLAGTPVLASDIGEIRDMLTTPEGPAGELFALRPGLEIDVEALAGRIADLAGSPDAVAAMRGRVPAAAARFDPQHMARRYDEVYRAAHARRQAGAPGPQQARAASRPRPRIAAALSRVLRPGGSPSLPDR